MSNPERLGPALYLIANRLKGSVVNKGLILALLLMVADIGLIAHYQPTVMLGLLRHTPVVPLFTGVLVNVTPALVLAGFWFCVGMTAAGLVGGDGARAVRYMFRALGLWLVSLFLFDASVVPTGFSLMVATSALGVLGWLAARFPNLEDEIVPTIVMFAALAVAGVTLSSQPLLLDRLAAPPAPAEKVQLKSETGTLVAFVIDVDPSGSWTTLLMEPRRELRIVATTDVIKRLPCRLTHQSAFRPEQPIVQPLDSTPPC